MELSVIIPIYNEEANILALHERLVQVIQPMVISYELIFVNDGSSDSSLSLLKQLAKKDAGVRFIDLSRNFGHQIAVTAGLDLSKGNAVVIIDADLQDPPELIEGLYQKWKEGHEIVYAKRISRKGESLMKKWTAKLFYRIMRRITHIDIPLDTGDFRIIDRKVVDVLGEMPEQEKFLRGQISWMGFSPTFIEYEREERRGGETGFTYSKMIRFALDGITSFSDFPLRVASVAGFVVSGVAFLLMIYAILMKLYSDTYVQGWASMMITILFLGGIQLIGIGIIGEYISRISNNVKQRPTYIIRESNIEQEGS